MPIHDAPDWKMDDRAATHVEFHAPRVRDEIAGIMGGLDAIDASWHDTQSFGAEVAAALMNLLADRLRDHRMEVSPVRTKELSHSDFLAVMMEDVLNRALVRKFRKAD